MSRFEDKKFCQVGTLMHRWDCGRDWIYSLASKGVIKVWHPEGSVGSKGMRFEVASILKAERNGYIDIES